MRKLSLCLVFYLVLVFAGAFFSAGAAAAQAAAPAAQPPSGPADQYVLNMTGVYPSTHPVMRDVLRPWAAALMEQTGGRLIVRFFEPRTAANPNRLARSVRLGQMSMGMGFLSSESDDFPLSLLASSGRGRPALRELSLAYWRMYTEIPELAAEFAGIRLLAACAVDPLQLCLTGKEAYDTASLRGRRFLLENPLLASKMQSFGAIPSIIAQADFKMFMEDRIADGLVLSLTDISRLDLGGHISGISLGDLENGVAWLGMHQGVWDMLPQDLRNILHRNSGAALSQALGAALSGFYRAELERLGESGVNLHYFSAEERERFDLHMRDMAEAAWQKAAREKGHNARALQERIARIMSEAKVR